jgi:hypothetical protein
MTDPLNETAEDVVARCLKRIDEALDRMGDKLRDDDRAVLRRVAEATFPAFCGSLQDARREGAYQYQLRAAGILIATNVFWEIVRTTTPAHLKALQAERYLALLTAAIQEGDYV